MKEVWVQLIVGFVAMFSAALATYTQIKIAKIQKENKTQKEVISRIETDWKALSILFDYIFYNNLQKKVSEIFDRTKANRFLILFAVNGRSDMRHVTVAFEMTRPPAQPGSISRYVRTEVDDHYIRMLKTVENVSGIELDVSTMNDSLLKQIYLSPVEKINHSLIKFIARHKVDEDNDLLLFSSTATTHEKQFDENEKIFIKLLHDSIVADAKKIIIQ